MGAITKFLGKKGVSYRALIRKKGMSPISKTFPKKGMAQDWINRIESQISSDTYQEDAQFFADVIRQYILEVSAIKPFGRSKLTTLYAISDALGHYRLQELTAVNLQTYARNRFKTCKPSTVQQDLSYVGTVLRTAESLFGAKPKLIELKKAQDNLTRMGVIANSDERDRRVSDAEISQVLANVQSERFVRMPVADWVHFALASAMRLGEIASLRYKDISADGKSIIIRLRKHPRKKRDQVVPLLPAARAIITRRRQNNPKDELIFPETRRSITTAYRRAVARAGIEDLTFHDLRHEAISRLFEMGFDSLVVAVFSGHRDINMLRRYTHMNANKVLEMLDRQEKLKQKDAA